VKRGTLLHTKEGDLDLGWVILLVGLANGLTFFDLAALGLAEVSIQAWAWYGTVITMCFIAGVSVSRARLIAKMGAPKSDEQKDSPPAGTD
jgi:hypothetical protein